MKVSYIRQAGKIDLSDYAKYTRGGWYEKRRSLLTWLTSHGIKLEILSQGMEPTGDILLCEFGSTNQFMYPEDIEYFISTVQNFRGKKIYLLDDPDLYFNRKWNLFFDELWINADFGNSDIVRKTFKIPGYTAIKFAPFYALQDLYCIESHYRNKGVYYGSGTGGRERSLTIISKHIDIDIYGKGGFDNTKANKKIPRAVDRPKFYSQYEYSLCLSDSKHKELGFITGRATHSVLAGCPVIVERNHYSLSKRFISFTDIKRSH